MSLFKRLVRLFLTAAEPSSGRSEPEASALAANLHSSAAEAYEAGDDPLPALRKRARATLQRFQRNGLEKAEIQAAKDSCEACKAQDGRVLEVETALREMPVPCKNCTRPLREGDEGGFCRCVYLPVTGLEGDGSGAVESRPLPG